MTKTLTTAQRIHALFREQVMKDTALAECINVSSDDWGNEKFYFPDGSVLEIMVNGVHRCQASTVRKRYWERLTALASDEFNDSAADVQHGSEKLAEVPEWAQIVADLNSL